MVGAGALAGPAALTAGLVGSGGCATTSSSNWDWHLGLVVVVGLVGGIRPARLFGRFVRGQATSSGVQPAGIGLGLAIVRGLVEAHAGTTGLEEPDGRPGATFRFALPEAPPPEAEPG
jgi:hypothetical protein